MLGTLWAEQKVSWSQRVVFVLAYKATQSDTTGVSLYFLMFGWESCLPIDLFFRVAKDSEGYNKHKQYHTKLWERLKEVYHLIMATARRNTDRHKHWYDTRVRVQDLQGTTAESEPHRKTHDRWKGTPY